VITQSKVALLTLSLKFLTEYLVKKKLKEEKKEERK